MPCYMLLYFRLLYFHVSNSVLFSTSNFSTLILYRRSFDTFYKVIVNPTLIMNVVLSKYVKVIYWMVRQYFVSNKNAV